MGKPHGRRGANHHGDGVVMFDRDSTRARAEAILARVDDVLATPRPSGAVWLGRDKHEAACAPRLSPDAQRMADADKHERQAQQCAEALRQALEKGRDTAGAPPAYLTREVRTKR